MNESLEIRPSARDTLPAGVEMESNLEVEAILRIKTISMRVYEEIVDFIAAGATPSTIAGKDRIAYLISQEKSAGLSLEDSSELDSFMKLEHLMRLIKARARSHNP